MYIIQYFPVALAIVAFGLRFSLSSKAGLPK
ncbi:hypothetical protein HNR39_002488 [Glaciimonas immobilis]|uniref:Uncharacterized protein n=1 Tax=Glaciimonas immobilis TaxID=728004 RepID=A0A840RUT8_9BURK|nr:hypothetical protein [Glaciimonas immobilis]